MNIKSSSLKIKSCTKFYSNTNSYGCGSKYREDDGILYPITNDMDFNNVKKLKLNIVLFLESSFFELIFINKLIDKIISNKIVGIVIYDSKVNILKHRSPNLQTHWNRNGTGLIFTDISVPLIWIDTNEADKMIKLSEYNTKVLDNGIHFDFVYYVKIQNYMGKHELMTSKKCLQWTNIYGESSPQCLPLGGQSIWGTANSLDERSKVIAVSSIDSNSVFHELTYGANDAIASILATLLAIESIGRSPHQSLPKQILFLLSNGEAFGSIGTQAFLSDISSFECKNNFIDRISGLPSCSNPIHTTTMFKYLSLNKIDSVISIDQIGIVEKSKNNISNYYIHSNGFNLLDSLSYSLNDSYITISQSSSSIIPPTSLDSFLNYNISFGYVLSGYDQYYIDNNFHSRFDTSDKISLTDIIRASKVLSHSLWLLADGNIDDIRPINSTLAYTLFDCLSNNWNCDLFQSFINYEIKRIKKYKPLISLENLSNKNNRKSKKNKPNYYVGVYSPEIGSQPVLQINNQIYSKYNNVFDTNKSSIYVIPNRLEAFLYTFLNYHLADDFNNRNIRKCITSSDCSKCSIYGYTVNELCILSKCLCPTAYYHNALDPGLSPDLNPGYFTINNADRPIYTEPYWNNLNLKVYQYSLNPYIGLISLSTGLLSFLLASYITLKFQKILLS